MKLRIIQILITIALIALDLTAQTVNTTQPQRKIALVIGNGNYQSGSILANPENDAKAMKVALESVGFTVLEYENLTQSQMKKAIDDFGMRLKNNEVGLFFYAGHGIQSKGVNYLIPVDAQLQAEQQIEYDCVQADRVLALMDASGSKVNIIILDACRNNPFSRSWTRAATGSGLAFMDAPSGTLIAYATSPGRTASDGSGKNGLYTSAILESMKIPDITILEMFQNVRSIVSEKSSKQQVPWESTSLTGNFYFNAKRSLGSAIQDNVQTTPLDNTVDTRINDLKIALDNDSINYEIGSLIDSRDKREYKTVKIGDQIWMAENLSYKVSEGCWAFDNNLNNATIYGYLYDWTTAKDICPVGWHLPTDIEWMALFTYLGGLEVAGGKLKEIGTKRWKLPNTEATNKSGFTALPGGSRSIDGRFNGIGESSYWWSATKGGPESAIDIFLRSGEKRGYKGSNFRQSGFSVRCIRDK